MLRERQKRRVYLLLVIALVIILIYFGGIPGFSSRSQTFRPSEIMNIPLAERTQGLTFVKRQFFLNGLPFRILSGAMHYFRVPEQYWHDRMKKMKACGLNTLETYVAWNLHEPVPGKFVYDGGLNLRKYLEVASEVGLYVILRPGPYICSEWDWGGLPSWLLGDPNMRVRSNYKPYQEAATRFFRDLMPRVVDLQFTQGGPIIAVQVENEFGAYSDEVEHLVFLKDLLRRNGITEQLVTSDGEDGHIRINFHDGVLPTANFKEVEKGLAIFEILKQLDSNFPLMVMEYWTGWFDHWGQPHNVDNVDEYAERVVQLFDTEASINFYMFHGGTNFGFMAGANHFFHYKADVTSYDYDAPLSEAGDVTGKYFKTRQLILEKVYQPLGITSLPDVPPYTQKANYGKLNMAEYLTWEDLTHLIEKRAESSNLQPMEMYKFANNIGQSYGYIIYRRQIGSGNKLSLPPRAHDHAQVLLNSVSVAVFDSDAKKLDVGLNASLPNNQLDVIVENLGRVNFVKFPSEMLNEQRKGLSGDVTLDGALLNNWQAVALDFDDSYLLRVSESNKWRKFQPQRNSPAFFRAFLEIPDKPKDTFVNTKGWKKGIVIVNRHNLGRYWYKGPQHTLYLPAPFLKMGSNEILVFEEFSSGEFVSFDSDFDLG